MSGALPPPTQLPQKYTELFRFLHGFHSDDVRTSEPRLQLHLQMNGGGQGGGAGNTPGLEVNVRDILTVINLRSIEYKQLKETHPLIDD